MGVSGGVLIEWKENMPEIWHPLLTLLQFLKMTHEFQIAAPDK